MIDITKLKCYRDFIPLRVVNIKQKGKPSSLYKVVKGEKEKVGSFVFSSQGNLCDLVIKKKYRGKKTSVNALLSILNFAKEKAKEQNNDSIIFIGSSANKNNVIRLYERFAHKINDLYGAFFIIPLTKKGQDLVDFYRKYTKNFDLTKDVENIIKP